MEQPLAAIVLSNCGAGDVSMTKQGLALKASVTSLWTK